MSETEKIVISDTHKETQDFSNGCIDDSSKFRHHFVEPKETKELEAHDEDQPANQIPDTLQKNPQKKPRNKRFLSMTSLHISHSNTTFM